MAGRYDTAVVVALRDLTDNQVGQMTKEFMKAKNKHAPRSRATIACGKNNDIGGMISGGGNKRIGRG